MSGDSTPRQGNGDLHRYPKAQTTSGLIPALYLRGH